MAGAKAAETLRSEGSDGRLRLITGAQPRRRSAAREFIAFWIAGDRVVAGMNLNVWEVNDDIQRLIGRRGAVDDRRLADPDVPLETLVPEGSSA